MSSWLVDRASSALERRAGRRSFLVGTAVVGSALVAAPKRYVLEPVSAYQAVCGTSGCRDSGDCCDGYTEFCCTLNGGENRCPPGSILAGWWKADGSGFCDVGDQAKPRYYMDCNAPCESGCGCGSSGVCEPSCYDRTCTCTDCSCAQRKHCCTRFRYGQCNQHVACVGAIICRVVTCTPPWLYSSSCTADVLTDNTTRFHDRPCLHEAPSPSDRSNVCVRRPGTNDWFLRDSLSSGPATLVLSYGHPDDVPVMGDWDGDGVKTPGVVRGGRQWLLRNSNTPGPADISFAFGQPGDIPVVGDWNGDGRDTPGVVRGGRQWFLRNSTTSGPADVTFSYGREGDVPIVGDWNGDGRDSPGVVRGGRQWLLRNQATSGPADVSFEYGRSGDVPVVGDWDADGRDEPGVVRGGRQWFLRRSASGGPAEIAFTFGAEGDVPLSW